MLLSKQERSQVSIEILGERRLMKCSAAEMNSRSLKGRKETTQANSKSSQAKSLNEMNFFRESKITEAFMYACIDLLRKKFC